jgi:hypothetical protein
LIHHPASHIKGGFAASLDGFDVLGTPPGQEGRSPIPLYRLEAAMRTSRQSIWRVALGVSVFLGVAWGQPWRLLAQAPAPATGVGYAQISETDLREWLSYLASDELQGRQVFTEGYGRASQYIAERLKAWGVKPLGASGTYFQPVKLKGYRVTRNSSVVLDANGQTRTFKHGDHVTFAVGSGGKQTLQFGGAEFMGYGLPADYEGRSVKGKLIVVIPNLAPAPAAAAGAAPPAQGGGRGRGGAAAGLAQGAAAVIAFAPPPAALSPAEQALAQALTALNQANAAVTQAQQALRGRGGQGGRGAGAQGNRGNPAPDLTTVSRVDGIVTPSFTADETFFEALFAGNPMRFADIRARAEKGEPLAPLSIAAKITINIDNTYEAISEQTTHNVVGMVEGSDPVLKDTYVLIGAHLDHVGYSQTGGGRGSGTNACRQRSPAAQAAVVAAGRTVQRPTPARGGRGDAPAAARGLGPAAPPAAPAAPAAPAVPLDQRDLISNGADDDGSGSTAILGIAKAFAAGPKPKRSVVFVWHSGEESGLYGSRFNADFPVVPLDKIQAALNMDMVGRDDCDNIEGDFTNSVFVVGADRISTDLHNLIIQTNGTLARPFTLDYELNDVNDPENVYTRSDHYSYAQKGIPVTFFTTGLHPDYHRITDSVEKIQFPKMTRIAQLVYQVGFSIANSERTLERDNKGARTGYGSKAEVLAK